MIIIYTTIITDEFLALKELNYMLRWHRDFSERIRIKLKLSHYAVYWISWLEGVLTVVLIWWIITLLG